MLNHSFIAQSPDYLSKHLWEEISRKLNKYDTKNRIKLRWAIPDIWNNISPETSKTFGGYVTILEI